LSRLQQYETDKCIGRYKGIQSPNHLFLSCYHYREDQKKLKDQLKEIFPKTEIITLTEIYNKKSRQIVYNYLKKTRIATRDWLLELEKEDEETESQEAGTQEEEQKKEETE
jgi:hypothetical protein